MTTPRPSSFIKLPRPVMDPAIRFAHLSQGNRPLEDHIQDFLNIAYHSDFLDFALIDFFSHELNEPLITKLISHGPLGWLCQFSDYALLLCGSPFTVGEAEDCKTPNSFLRVQHWQAPMAMELGQSGLPPCSRARSSP